MNIAFFRDLVIIIFGLAAIGMLIFMAAMLYSIYRELKAAREHMHAISEAAKAAGPLLQIVEIVTGVTQALNFVKGFMKKKEGSNEQG